MRQRRRESNKDIDEGIKWIEGDVLRWNPPSDVSLILCDPPYGTGNVFKGKYGLPDLDDRDRDLPLHILRRLLSLDIPLCIFGEPRFLMRVRRVPEKILFWRSSWISGFKAHSCFPRQIDVILCYNLRVRNPVTYEGKTLGNLISIDKCTSVLHKSFVYKTGVPTEKCAEIGKILAEAFSNPDDLVVDACCGGGWLARGASQAGRRVIAVDNCHEYLDAARGATGMINKKRIRKE